VGYFDLNGSGEASLFDDRLAYIGIAESGDLSSILLRYEAEGSRYGVWVPELDFRDGEGTGRVFELEARGAETYADGVAVLNLRWPRAVEVWAVQRDQTGAQVAEAFLGELAPGAKMLDVISQRFPFAEGAKYTIEARGGGTIQVMGLSFLGEDFFASIPAVKLD
jgi:hypothetical protein